MVAGRNGGVLGEPQVGSGFDAATHLLGEPDRLPCSCTLTDWPGSVKAGVG